MKDPTGCTSIAAAEALVVHDTSHVYGDREQFGGHGGPRSSTGPCGAIWSQSLGLPSKPMAKKQPITILPSTRLWPIGGDRQRGVFIKRWQRPPLHAGIECRRQLNWFEVYYMAIGPCDLGVEPLNCAQNLTDNTKHSTFRTYSARRYRIR